MASSCHSTGRLFFIFPEEMLCPFGYRQQPRLIARDFHQVAQAFQMRAEALGNLARCVVFKLESAGLCLLAFCSRFVLNLSSSSASALPLCPGI